MRLLPIIAMLLAAGPALAQSPPPTPADPAAPSEWNRLSNESRRMEQEREQRQIQSQQQQRFEAERQDMERQRRNDLDRMRMERDQERRMPQR